MGRRFKGFFDGYGIWVRGYFVVTWLGVGVLFWKWVRFCRVVSAMFFRASLVKKAWWPVMRTLGKVMRRMRVSSWTMPLEKSWKKKSRSSS